ncbi:unnamed protein product [Trifolium pratense]|uniref:Uncharacterized protein n=1 Tax=Trifolium pratense TaxID=57577 RepID=A0ACB0J844_TRIPR|nr:unnamed protein product [Trifolium pratense]
MSVHMDLEKSSSAMVFRHPIQSNNDLVRRFYLYNEEPHQIITPIHKFVIVYHHKLQLQANRWTSIFICVVDVQTLKYNLGQFSQEDGFFILVVLVDIVKVS